MNILMFAFVPVKLIVQEHYKLVSFSSLVSCYYYLEPYIISLLLSGESLLLSFIDIRVKL